MNDRVERAVRNDGEAVRNDGETVRSEIRFITRFEEEFPERLRFIPGCPSGIYVKGDLPNPEIKTVAIVGARACSEYGKKMAQYFASHLAAAGVQIVSGLARGIDGIAQRAALDAGGVTFGVLGCGADVVYPKENEEIYRLIEGHGGLITEHPAGTPPLGPNFASRNRIIAGLCDILLVIEARLRSGTSITVNNALEQGRDIFAVPGRLTDGLSAGCNMLIRDGAGAALNPDDILKALGMLCEEPVSLVSHAGETPHGKKSNGTTTNGEAEAGNATTGKTAKFDLTPKERLVYECLDLYPKTVDEIMRTCRISVSETLERLMSLCLKGAAKECGRSNYIKMI
ncbi:MAG: DNA-processing protein DprA [Lachnospiraceae bacterium]|nr:DNA-processing protein DprA [Lachnospiraceae bacterium]